MTNCPPIRCYISRCITYVGPRVVSSRTLFQTSSRLGNKDTPLLSRDLMGRLGSCVCVRSRAVVECVALADENISTRRMHVPLSHHQSCVHAWRQRFSLCDAELRPLQGLPVFSPLPTGSLSVSAGSVHRCTERRLSCGGNLGGRKKTVGFSYSDGQAGESSVISEQVVSVGFNISSISHPSATRPHLISVIRLLGCQPVCFRNNNH